jgi:hypothetical protein
MKLGRRLTFSPATALALLALFFALGGSAFALGERIQAATVAQQRCTNGAVRGLAVVTGDPSKGIANVGDRFTGAPVVFARRFNCSRRPVQVRRTGIGVYEVRFLGNAASTALAGGFFGGYAGVDPLRNGVFRVSVFPSGKSDPEDLPFTIVLF